MEKNNLKLAVQKKGRLSEKSLNLLRSCGIDIENYAERLLVTTKNFNLDLLFLRDDDIPEYVQDGVADIGIVGENVIYEKEKDVEVVKKLGFGKCKLMMAFPEGKTLDAVDEINGKIIATSYPKILGNFLNENNVKADIIQLSGSVEIAPSLGIADLICDIVSTGNTLKMNKLKKSFPIFNSEAVLIKSKKLSDDVVKSNILDELCSRIDSALTAKKSKYLMMNIPKNNLKTILEIIPSLKSPTVLPLADDNLVAIHAVIPNDTFWDINTLLKENGASGILLLPIDNMIV
ncbi:MAG: ATP phosphoribosyltransferase [Melioribacteraceae bacterium]|nr:ATP phosphoribosyltransferase [Melioribacteraceae bacterium]